MTPYGVETVLLLRLEKGFLHVGVDTDGTTSPADVGWGEVAAKKKADFIGKRSLRAPTTCAPTGCSSSGSRRPTNAVLVPGAHLRLPGTAEGSDGWVTSAAHVARARPDDRARDAARRTRAARARALAVHDLERNGQATVVSPTFLDPEGKRLHA